VNNKCGACAHWEGRDSNLGLCFCMPPQIVEVVEVTGAWDNNIGPATKYPRTFRQSRSCGQFVPFTKKDTKEVDNDCDN